MLIKKLACVALSAMLVCAFAPVAFADEAVADDEAASEVVGGDTESTIVRPSELVGTTFKVGKATYKITKLTYSSVDNGTSTVELVEYSGAGSAKIPATVKHEVEYSFGNFALTAVTPTFKVTAIGKAAFKGKKALKTLVIGENVVKIGAEAFKNCTKLNKITYKGKALGNAATFTKKGKLKKCPIGKDAFAGTPRSSKTYTPTETNWKKLQFKQGVRASMSKAGYKGIVY